jgi:hypothetical protein
MVSPFPVSPLERVREGMSVVDAQNQRLGRVARVFPGYPNAVSTNDDELPSGLVGMIIAPLENTGGTSTVGAGYRYVIDRILDDPDVPDELRLELLRSGFIEVDGPGLSGAARYIDGDKVAAISDEDVRLNIVHPSRAGHSKPIAPARVARCSCQNRGWPGGWQNRSTHRGSIYARNSKHGASQRTDPLSRGGDSAGRDPGQHRRPGDAALYSGPGQAVT